jgi:hypothetical protein
MIYLFLVPCLLFPKIVNRFLFRLYTYYFLLFFSSSSLSLLPQEETIEINYHHTKHNIEKKLLN